MRRGTTPTFTFEVDFDLSGWDVYVTFRQRGETVTRKDAEVVPANEGEGCIVAVELTQAETLAFRSGSADAQIRAVKDGEAVATQIFEFCVGDILLDGEIPQEV